MDMILYSAQQVLIYTMRGVNLGGPAVRACRGPGLMHLDPTNYMRSAHPQERAMWVSRFLHGKDTKSSRCLPILYNSPVWG